MEFTWDEAKRRVNFIKHGVDFTDARTVFSGATFTFEDARFAYGEQRFITLGMLKGTVVVIAHTEWNDVVRVISRHRKFNVVRTEGASLCSQIQCFLFKSSTIKSESNL